MSSNVAKTIVEIPSKALPLTTGETPCGPVAASMTPKEVLEDTLKVDRNHRYDGVRCDLFSVAELRKQTWDYSLTTWSKPAYYDRKLRKNVPGKPVFADGVTDQSFMAALDAKFPILGALEGTAMWSNLLLAGGALQRTLQKMAVDLTGYQDPFKGKTLTETPFPEPEGITDLDLFIYGLDEAAALEKVRAVAGSLRKWCDEHALETRYVRSNQALSVIVTEPQDNSGNKRRAQCSTVRPKFVVQLVFRRYTALSEILHGFDLGCAAVGWNGQRLFFTSLAKLAYEYGVVVFDNTRRSETYEHRLTKYFKRGFSVVVQNFAVPEGVPEHGRYIRLNPRIDLRVLKITGQRYEVKLNPRGQRSSDYGLLTDITAAHIKENNLKQMMRGNKDGYLYEGGNLEEILAGKVALDEGALDSTFAIAKQQLRLERLPNTAYKYLQHFYTVGAGELLERRLEPGYLEGVLEAEKARIRLRSVGLGNPVAFHRVVKNGELVCSFNPIKEEERTWFGEYYAGPAAE